MNVSTLKQTKTPEEFSSLGRRIPPVSLITPALALMFIWLGTVIYFACLPPWVGIEFEPSKDGKGVIVKSVDVQGPAYKKLKKGDLIASVTSGERTLYILPGDIILEPDAVSKYETYNLFFEKQTQLYDLLQKGEIEFVLLDGSVHKIKPRPRRPVRSLPWLFWYQVLCGVFTFIAGVSVWVTRSGDRILSYYALTGLGLLLAASSAAIYSTRELALNANIFYRLSLLNQFGSYLFCGPFLAVMWNYPKPLGRPLVGDMFVIAFLFFWIINYFQFPETLDAGMRYPLLLGVVALVVLGVWQWLISPTDPLSRAILKWFLLAWMLSAMLYVGLVSLPLLFGMESIIDQSIAWVILLLVYLGIMAGILKYQLFNIGNWILNFWLWLFAGLLVVGLDAFLIFVFGFGELLSLALSLVLAGWIYFPARQWIWEKILQFKDGSSYRDFYIQAANGLFEYDDSLNMDEQWKIQLKSFFQPLSLTEFEGESDSIRIEDQGLKLYVPNITNQKGLVLMGARNGRYLFNKQDIQFVVRLRDLLVMAYKVEQATRQGAIEERKRIARDLHDNVGAKLLSLIYRSEGRGTQELARESLKELRELIQGLETRGETLGNLLYLWFEEADRRCQEANIILNWEEDLKDNNYTLNARQYLNLKAIFSELLSNIIKHSKANELQIVTEINEESGIGKKYLEIKFSDNGEKFVLGKNNSGSGIYNIKQRIDEINATIEWYSEEDQNHENVNKSIIKVPLTHIGGY